MPDMIPSGGTQVTEDDPLVERFFVAVTQAPLSSAAIAQAAGCTRQQVEYVRARARKPRIDLAERIAKAIGYRLVLEPIHPPEKKRAVKKRGKSVDKGKKSG
jgi:DNA-binding phage protein